MKERAADALIEVRVTRRAASSRLTMSDEGLRAWVHAPPAEGKANEAVIELLSRALGVPRSVLRMVRGERSRNKTVAVSGINQAQLDRIIKERIR